MKTNIFIDNEPCITVTGKDVASTLKTIYATRPIRRFVDYTVGKVRIIEIKTVYTDR